MLSTNPRPFARLRDIFRQDVLCDYETIPGLSYDKVCHTLTFIAWYCVGLERYIRISCPFVTIQDVKHLKSVWYVLLYSDISVTVSQMYHSISTYIFTICTLHWIRDILLKNQLFTKMLESDRRMRLFITTKEIAFTPWMTQVSHLHEGKYPCS